jgi:hypothetical protein
MSSIFDLIANYNPAGFALRNQQAAANVGQTQAVTQGQQLQNQVAQQQIKDAQVVRQVYAEMGSQQPAQAAPPPSPSGGANPPSGVPNQPSGGPNTPPAAAPAPPPNYSPIGGYSTNTAPIPQPSNAAPRALPAAAAQPMSEQAPNGSTSTMPFDNPLLFVSRAAQLGASPVAAMGIAKDIIAMRQNLLKLPADQLAAQDAMLATTKGGLQQILQPGQMTDQNYAAWYQQAARADITGGLVKTLPPPRPGYVPSQQDLAGAIGYLRMTDALVNNAKSRQETATSAAQEKSAEATATETASKTALTNAQAQRAEYVNTLIKQGQTASQNGQNPVDSVFPASLDPQINSSYKAAYGAAMSQPPDENGRRPAADTILTAAAAHAASIRLPSNPQVIAGEVNKARQVAAATAPIEEDKALAVARALRMGDNPAVANVAPAAVATVQNQAIKLDQDYAGAKAATETLGRVIDLAESGNAAAGANVAPLGAAGVAAVNGIKRLNPSLVEGYGNAGSILQDIQGKLSHWEGKGPLPKDLMEEIRELHQTVGQQSYQTYTDNLKSLNARTGSTFSPTLPAPDIRKGGAPAPAAPKFKVGDSVMYQGRLHKITAVNPQTGKISLEP